MEEDGIITEEVCIDFGDNPPCEVEEGINVCMAEAAKTRLSKEGEEQLRKIIQRNKSVLRLRLGSAGPAKTTPMKIRLDESKEPVKVKVRKYAVEQ